MGVDSWIFIRGIFWSFLLFFSLFCYFSVFFSVGSSSGRGLIVLFSVYFAIFRSSFPLPGNFSADALDFRHSNLTFVILSQGRTTSKLAINW